MTPRTVLYEHNLSEFDVPAYPRPSAMRSLTGKAMDVFTTASTWSSCENRYVTGLESLTMLNMFSTPMKMTTMGNISLSRHQVNVRLHAIQLLTKEPL